MSKTFYNHLSDLILSIPEEKLPPLFDRLSKSADGNEIRNSLSDILKENTKICTKLTKLLSGSDERVEITSTALCLGIRQRMLDENIEVTPVCTVKKELKMNLPATEDAILALINQAEQSIYIFGYWLTSGAQNLVTSLIKARERGVDIIILGDSIQKFFLPFVNAWKTSVDCPAMYVFQYEKSREGTIDSPKMHAKTLIVDDSKMLITSANLTFRAMSDNLEIGVIVRDRNAVRALGNLINRLIHDSDVFKRVTKSEVLEYQND